MVKAISADEFDRDPGTAMDATKREPVFITNQGRPEHVLLSIEQYQNLAGPKTYIVELLALRSGDADISFDPPPVNNLHKPADLS